MPPVCYSLGEEKYRYFQAYGRRTAEIALTYLMAGCVAELRHTKGQVAEAFLVSGSLDMEHAHSIANAWLVPTDGAIKLAKKRARALTGSKMGWSAVCAMADYLLYNGTMTGRTIEEICFNEFGDKRPTYDAWREFWPASIAQLRAGHIPEFSSDVHDEEYLEDLAA